MNDKLLVFIYKENKFLKYQIVNDNNYVKENIDKFNELKKDETAKIIYDEDIRQVLFQKESLETVKSYVDRIHEDIESLKNNLEHSFDNFVYSYNDFYDAVKDRLEIKEN